MLFAGLLKWTLIMLMFVALPVAFMRLMVYKTIEIRHKDRH